MTKLIRFGLCILLSSVFACGDNDGDSNPDPDDFAARAECNPLAAVNCMLPWPSSAYLAEDTGSGTGYRVDFPREAMPINADDIVTEPEFFNRYDGFPVSGMIVAGFPTGVSRDGLPPHSDIAASMENNSSILLIDLETGEKHPIFAEPDMNAAAPEERALIIRPVKRLKSATRYAVGIRNTVKSADGSDLPIPSGFAEILAGEESEHPLAARLDNYDEIFAKLDAAGMPKEEIVLAWDFVTASDEFLSSDLLSMREKGLEVVADEELGFEFEEIANPNPTRLRAFLNGTYDAPSFLTAGEAESSILARNAEGLPEYQQLERANVSVLIPKCVETAELPIPVVVFGHGMFGTGEDALESGFLQTLADEECAVVLGGDWIGLTQRQFAGIAFAMNDINRAVNVTEKLAQAIVNYMTLQKLVRGPFLSAPEFSYEGSPIMDPTQISYFGASLGGILGGVYMSYEPDITRGALGVPGGPWSLLFERSVFWPPLRIAMKGAYPKPWDYALNVAMLGMIFEKVDPIAMSSRVIRNPLPDTPEKQLLLYSAIGDALVANIASDAYARSLEIPVVGPSVMVPYGLEETTDTLSSGYVIFDENVSPLPPDHNALEDLETNSTHGDVHEWPAVRRQVFTLLTEGTIASECSLNDAPAPCACDMGACN